MLFFFNESGECTETIDTPKISYMPEKDIICIYPQMNSVNNKTELDAVAKVISLNKTVHHKLNKLLWKSGKAALQQIGNSYGLVEGLYNE